MKIARKVVVVAGGSAGIGLSCARAFAQKGPRSLILVARRESRLREAVQQIRARHLDLSIEYITADLSTSAGAKKAADEIRERHGTPDILCISAGAGYLNSIEEETEENLRLHIDSTVMSAFNLTRAFIQEMVRRNSGHIVYAGGSPAIHVPHPSIAYITSRSALYGLARSLKEDLHDTAVRVTYTESGAIKKEQSAYFEDYQGSHSRIPLAGLPGWLSGLVTYDSDWIGRKIVAHVERGRFLYRPFVIKLACFFGSSSFSRRITAHLMRWATVPFSRGGPLSGNRNLKQKIDQERAVATAR